MLRRSRPAQLNYNVEPSTEGKQLLAEEACGRIKIIEGSEYLDGYPLPPDNDDLWHPRMLTARVYKFDVNKKTGEMEAWKETYEFPSTFTNKYVRETNIGCIAIGHSPLYITWEQLRESRLSREAEQRRLRQEKFERSWLGKGVSCLGIDYKVT